MYRLRDRLVVSYGVGDQYSMETTILVSTALSMLGHPVGRVSIGLATRRYVNTISGTEFGDWAV